MKKMIKMKKITSFLLMLTMLISIIYFPGLTINISANETLPNKAEMVRGKYFLDISNSTPISDATQFRAMKPGGRYHLTKDIYLDTLNITTSAHTPMFHDDNVVNKDTKLGFVLDGGGYTIYTGNMIFEKLPPASNVCNFVIQGALKYTSTDGTGDHVNSIYSNSKTVYTKYEAEAFASLCGKFFGGTVKNIINKANVHVQADTSNVTINNKVYTEPYLNANIRVSGLIGTCYDNDTLIQNCENRGNIIARVGGADILPDPDTIKPGSSRTMGGILAYGGLNSKKLYIADCKNTGNITNYSTGTVYVGVGGVVGYSASYTEMINCVNTGTLKLNSTNANVVKVSHVGQGNGGWTAENQKDNTTNKVVYVSDATAIASVKDFMDITSETSDDIYYVTETVNNVPQNPIKFTGTIYGLTRSMGFLEPPFADYGGATFNSFVPKVAGWTKITNETELAQIVNDGTAKDVNGNLNTQNRYYLGASFSLSSTWKGPTAWSGSVSAREKSTNNQPNIILEGCGFTITTSKPIFPELPGGGVGNDGTHSVIRNFVIAGNITVDEVALANTNEASYSAVNSYNNGRSVGALVGKANGGIFENITNNANITLNYQTNARVGGIIGSIFNDDITMTNCVNNGKIMASVSGDKYGVGGIAGLVGYNENGSARGVNAKFINCVNNGTVTNTSSEASHVYAGGILGVKYTPVTTGFMIDCTNNGKVFAKTAYGKYIANRLQQNLHVIDTIPIRTAEEFMQISGKKAYSLANDITITNYNTNDFEGFLVGNGHTVTTPERLFEDSPNAHLIDVTVKPQNMVINGRKLDSYAIVASSETDKNAVKIRDHISTNYSITLPIYTPSRNYTGNAIYIDLGNNYHVSGTDSGKQKTRFGFDYGFNDSGHFEIYLDGKDDTAKDNIVTDFIDNKIPAGKSEFDFFTLFGDKNFTYSFSKPEYSSGITIERDVIRPLDDGVKFIERTYRNKNNVSVEVCILVIEADADAHLEVVAAQTTDVSNCSNSANCKNVHVNASAQKTVSEFASLVESQGKEVMAAVNGGYFMKSAKCNTPWGAVIVDGTVVREPWEGVSGHGSRWFGITYDGTPVCGDYTQYPNYKGKLQYAVDGKYYLIKGGNYVHHSSINGNTDARTAIGFNADGDIVIVAVAGDDNNTAKTPGLSLVDMSQVFMDLDMDITYALNLDGGGSTAMMVDDANGILNLETPQYSSGVVDSKGKVDTTVQRKISDAIVLVRNKK